MLKLARLFFTACLLTATPLLAHHGPGTTGGGLSTQSAETLAGGKATLIFRADYTAFETLSKAQIEAMTLSVGGPHVHLDVLEDSLVQTLGLAYGVTDSLQLEATFLGRYRGVNMREGHTHGNGSYGFHVFGDVVGETDAWVNVKWQVAKARWGRLALLGGVKLPTGTTNARTGETSARELATDLQPGSGSVDWVWGLAYSRFLTGRLTLDADLRHTRRLPAKAFRAGDRFDGGLALAWRLTADMEAPFRVSTFVEANLVSLGKNREWDNIGNAWSEEGNTGGSTVYFSPGLKLSAGEGFGLSLAYQVPVSQSLNSVQQKIDSKASAVITMGL